MRILILIILLIFTNISFTQDTTFSGKDIYIYKDGRLIQKEFNSSENFIKVVYVYDDFGILVRRFWYNKNGKLIGATLDD